MAWLTKYSSVNYTKLVRGFLLALENKMFSIFPPIHSIPCISPATRTVQCSQSSQLSKSLCASIPSPTATPVSARTARLTYLPVIRYGLHFLLLLPMGRLEPQQFALRAWWTVQFSKITLYFILLTAWSQEKYSVLPVNVGKSSKKAHLWKLLHIMTWFVFKSSPRRHPPPHTIPYHSLIRCAKYVT